MSVTKHTEPAVANGTEDLFDEYPSFRDHVSANNGRIDRDVMIENSRLTEDAWKEIDGRVVEIAQQELSTVMRLEQLGLDTPVGNLGVKFWQWNQVQDPQEANVDMDFQTGESKFSVDFADEGVPMPIVHLTYDHSLRDQLASENAGIPLDSTADALAAKLVSQKLEDMVDNGESSVTVTVNGTQQSIDGYTSHGNRQTITLDNNWDTGSGTPKADVLEAIQALKDNGDFNGPYDVYVSGNYATVLEEDFDTSTGDPRSTREAIEEINNVNGVFISDQLADHNIVVADVNQTGMSVELGVIEPIQTVDVSESRFGTERMVFASMAPGIKSNANSQAGVAHIS